MKAAAINTPTSKPEVVKPEPKPLPVTLAQNRPPATFAPQPSTAKQGELPKTASNLPLEVAIGLFLLAVGAGILRLGLRRSTQA
jgi:LPXTG-motif cell wall-anchored protein